MHTSHPYDLRPEWPSYPDIQATKFHSDSHILFPTLPSPLLLGNSDPLLPSDPTFTPNTDPDLLLSHGHAILPSFVPHTEVEALLRECRSLDPNNFAPIFDTHFPFAHTDLSNSPRAIHYLEKGDPTYPHISAWIEAVDARLHTSFSDHLLTHPDTHPLTLRTAAVVSTTHPSLQTPRYGICHFRWFQLFTGG